MDKKFLVERDILFYAFRYSLGRMTFAPIIVMENIKANIDNISTDDIKVYIKEIKERENFGYGMECDKRDWLNFVSYLEDEIKRR
jgi:hypothetical protein